LGLSHSKIDPTFRAPTTLPEPSTATQSEVDGQDTWQRSTLAGALTSGSFKQLAQATDHVEAWLLSRYPEGVRMERSLTSFEDAGGIG
jgi:uncharacterized protein YlxP (DUF503 family)